MMGFLGFFFGLLIQLSAYISLALVVFNWGSYFLLQGYVSVLNKLFKGQNLKKKVWTYYFLDTRANVYGRFVFWQEQFF
jgi:hypothetical protein